MPKSSTSPRAQRVGDMLRKELATMIMQEVTDPRLGMVTVNEVRVSKDLAYAYAYTTVMGKDSPEDAADSLAVLNGAAGYLRTLLAKKVKLRIVPKLTFYFDATLSEGVRMSALIDKAIKDDASHKNADEN